MTQLFDTANYDNTDRAPDGAGNDAVPHRHLRSIPTGAPAVERSTQWQLDQETIAAGRRGIALARQTLQEVAKTSTTTETDESTPKRRAA